MFLGLAAGLWSCQKRSRGSLRPAAVGTGPAAPRIARRRRRRASRTPQNVSVCLKVAFLCFKILLFCVCVSKPSTMSKNSCPSHFAVEGADPQQLPRLVVLSLVELVPSHPTCTSSRRSQPLLSSLRCPLLAGLLQQSLGRAGVRVTSTCLRGFGWRNLPRAPRLQSSRTGG